MKLPRSIRNLIEAFERLPGIGPKTAARLSYYLLQSPEGEANGFAQALLNLRKETKICSICKNIDESDPCSVCADPQRVASGVICVVEKPLDVLALEKSGRYPGLYHVLGGAISPLNNIGPEQLYIESLAKRLEVRGQVSEVILATNASLEGETTAMYLSRLIKGRFPGLKVTRIGRGLPVGADLEYTDEITLTRALEGRQEY